MKKKVILKIGLFILFAGLQMSISLANSHVWIAIDLPDTIPAERESFSTDLKISSWSGEPGAMDLVITYDPAILKLTNFLMSEDSPFSLNYSIDTVKILGEIRLTSFQLEKTRDWDTIQTIATISWFVIASSSQSTDIDLEVKDLVESSWKPVEVYAFGQHIELNPTYTTSVPNTLELGRNYPNPFNSYTTIDYYVPNESDVSIKIYNVSGQLVSNLVNEFKPQGNYNIVWNGTDNSGILVKSGVYFYRMKAGLITLSNKMLFIKR